MSDNEMKESELWYNEVLRLKRARWVAYFNVAGFALAAGILIGLYYG
jgi:hypothetical protein